MEKNRVFPISARSFLLFCCFFLCFNFIVVGVVFAQDEMPDDEDHSGEYCGDCHLDYLDAWSTGVHAIAYDRESFQEAWAETDNDPECLQCHTTQYEPANQTYLSENIHCEACHGQNPSDHPPATFEITADTSTCGDCHTATFDEWRHSQHAFTEDMGAVGCATCHNPHGQTIRFETVDELCLNCHKDNPENTHEYANSYVHLTHNEVDFEGVDVTCASCHMHGKEADEIHQLADHTMHVETAPCTDCHESISVLGTSPLIVDVDTALAEQRDELQARVVELEDELAITEAEEPSGVNYVQLTQGLIVGLGFGITLVVVVMRRPNGGRSA